MRVIAGSWRGRRLRVPRGQEIRPTADRVKEAMFSILGADLTGSIFLDLCSGAGGLSIEALSRGAEQAVLIDTSARALAAAEDNLVVCGAPAHCWRLVRAEALGWLRRWAPPAEGRGWILVADPPYGSGLAAELATEVLALRGDPGFRRAIIEHGASAPPLGEEEGVEVRRYGGSCLRIFNRVSCSRS